MQVSWEPSQRLKRYIVSILVKYYLFKSSCDLENEEEVVKFSSALKLVPMIYPCKFSEIQYIGSKYIVNKRNCHAETENLRA